MPKPPAMKTPAKRYGAEPYDARKPDAILLLDGIKAEFADVDFFTREDLLHTTVFDHVATITRYQKVRIAVRYLLDQKLIYDYGWVPALSRSELCLPDKAKLISGRHALEQQFQSTVFNLCVQRQPQSQFAIMDIVTDWTTDQHLTTNAKRVLTRALLRRMARQGVIHDAGDYLYSTGA
jgi:hypothetical protein